MSEPRTLSGRAAVSALRPHVRRAISTTITAIEDEAAAPYRAALRDVAELLRAVAAADPSKPSEELVERARTLLARSTQEIDRDDT